MTRERVPLDWAKTQNNLGLALVALGDHESGTEKLEQGVAAHQGALEVYEHAGASFYIELVRGNFDRAQRLLAERHVVHR